MTSKYSKQSWRRVLRRRITLLSSHKRKQASARIHKKLYKLKFFQDADAILFYAAKTDEVDTFPAIRYALKQGKRVFLPYLGATGCMIRCRQVKRLRRDIIKGRYGIYEPRARCPLIRKQALDLVVCPALGFDRTGIRLGRGGGYYDRFLKTLGRKTQVVGLAFSCQIVSKLPNKPHDVRVPDIVSG